MTKQKLEGVLSKTLKNKENIWYIKLQVHPLAHCKTPADFLILGKLTRYLIECKQIKIDNRWTFDRLTQEDDLLNFTEDSMINQAYVLFLWFDKNLKNSHFYLIPIYNYYVEKLNLNKKSLGFKEFNKIFSYYQIKILKGGILTLDMIE